MILFVCIFSFFMRFDKCVSFSMVYKDIALQNKGLASFPFNKNSLNWFLFSWQHFSHRISYSKCQTICVSLVFHKSRGDFLTF